MAEEDASPRNKFEYAQALGFSCYADLLARHYDPALAQCDQAIGMEPGTFWMRADRAHALMMLGHTEEARAIYRAYRGKLADGDWKWEDAVKDDFTTMRKFGVNAPLMAEIEADFAKPAVSVPK